MAPFVLFLVALSIQNGVSGLKIPQGISKQKLYLVPKDRVEQDGSVCLDGTQPGFYYSPAEQLTNTSWVIFFQGGGYCYDEHNCHDRSRTRLGSSSKWGPTIIDGGVLSSDSRANPFASFHRVFVMYCDGFFYSGNKEEPVEIEREDGNHKVYLRGRRVLDAILDTLDDMGLDTADELVVGGASAGGIATYLHGDYIKSRYASLKRYGLVPVSGFFLDHISAQGDNISAQMLQDSSFMHNLKDGITLSSCKDAVGEDDVYLCLFANNSYNVMESNTFVINSDLDKYSLDHIWRGDTDCLHNNFVDCSPSEVDDLNGWAKDFRRDFQNSKGSVKKGNGAFIESCFEHVAAERDTVWEHLMLNGVNLKDAVNNWWLSNGEDSAEDHTYIGCFLKETAPHMCNPTCKVV